MVKFWLTIILGIISSTKICGSIFRYYNPEQDYVGLKAVSCTIEELYIFLKAVLFTIEGKNL